MKIEVTVQLNSADVDDILVAHVERVIGPPPSGMRYHCDVQSWGGAEVKTRPIPQPPPVDNTPTVPASL
jgi:hypothetical protein